MTTLFVYRAEDNQVVPRISGDDDKALLERAESEYCSNDFCYTFTPAFGESDGLVPGDDVVDIDV